MVRLVRAEKMVLSGLVFARKIARIILIQNIKGLMGPLMINMAFMPLYMWEMWDVTPVTDGRTVESSAVFCLSRIRKSKIKHSSNPRYTHTLSQTSQRLCHFSVLPLRSYSGVETVDGSLTKDDVVFNRWFFPQALPKAQRTPGLSAFTKATVFTLP